MVLGDRDVYNVARNVEVEDGQMEPSDKRPGHHHHYRHEGLLKSVAADDSPGEVKAIGRCVQFRPVAMGGAMGLQAA